MTTQIKLRRDTDANWTTNSTVVLAEGEIGVNLTNGQFKLGNGTSTWAELSYFETGPANAVVNGLLNITLNATGDFIPSTDILQDLGSATNRFRHVYVGPGSVYIGNNVITESATGGLVLPGVTRATGYYAEEVDDEDNWGSNPTITGTVTVIDATRYQILAGQNPSANYNPATYTVQKDGNKIDEINVSNGGSGWTKAEADYARNNNMYATNVVDAINNFNAGDWTQIPFRVEIKAEDTEYEDIFGGNANTGNVVFDNNQLYVGGTGFLNLENSDDQIEIGSNNEGPVKVSVNEGDKAWYFNVNGTLQLPAGGDVVDSSGNSVLGGGGINFDEDGALNLVNYGVIRNITDSGNVNIVASNNYVQLQWTNETGASAEDPNSTSEPTNYLWVDSEGTSIQTNVNGSGDSHTWLFNNTGGLEFPDGSIQTTAYTGGGSNSYTPEDTDHWNEPTVNTVQAALDELAARVTALQNYEIDGGNAYTPPQGETIIDGNGA